jgi:hypothetical protein
MIHGVPVRLIPAYNELVEAALAVDKRAIHS